MTCSPAKTVYFSAEMHSSVPGNEWCYLIRLVALYDCNSACERRVDTVPAESAKAITKAQQRILLLNNQCPGLSDIGGSISLTTISQLTGILVRKGAATSTR